MTAKSGFILSLRILFIQGTVRAVTNESLLNKQSVSINDTSFHTDKPQGFVSDVMLFNYAFRHIWSFLMRRGDHRDRCFSHLLFLFHPMQA